MCLTEKTPCYRSFILARVNAAGYVISVNESTPYIK